MMESQEEDVEEETSSQQQMIETQDEQEEQQTSTEVEADAPVVDLKEMAKQVRGLSRLYFSGLCVLINAACS